VRAEFKQAVPVELQKGFCSILSRTIRAQEQQAWATLYGLTLPAYRDGKTSEQFVNSAGSRPYALRDFKVVRVGAMGVPRDSPPNATWIVLGCAETQQGQKKLTAEAETDVYLENGEWYSLSVGLLLKMDDPHPTSACDLNSGVDVSFLCPR
jgi:hypothetical protein